MITVHKSDCPECGAPLPGSGLCRDLLDACLVLEFSNPAYFAVHHLSVPTYLLQHPSQLSRLGWLTMRDALKRSLTEEGAPGIYDRKFRERMQSDRRDFRFHDGVPMDLPSTLRWTKTIADVRLIAPDDYCADIRAWAQTVIEVTERTI